MVDGLGKLVKPTELNRALQLATQIQYAGRLREAAGMYEQILVAAPEHPIALNSLGVISLAVDDPTSAEAYFVRATKSDASSPDLHINVAKARRILGDDNGEEDSLKAALALDRRHFVALLRLAELQQRREEHADAITTWTNVLASIDFEDASPELDEIRARAKRYLSSQRDALESALNHGFQSIRADADAGDLKRFDACLDVVLGRRRLFVNECAGIHFPFLPADEFFDRRLFPWFAELESHTHTIRDELLTTLKDGATQFRPYVDLEPGMPDNLWTALDKSPAWRAIHLWRHGRLDEAACARFPRTVAILNTLPLAHLPDRMPTVFFSIIDANSHLPPHTGVSNTRAIIHLPLIVPEGCRFRVGGETRTWKVGQAWAFDDTIEHEAWNDSLSLRAILILDTWNPHLSSIERKLLTDFFAISDKTSNAFRTRIAD